MLARFAPIAPFAPLPCLFSPNCRVLNRKALQTYPFIPYEPVQHDPSTLQPRVKDFREYMHRRRTVRDFAPTPVPQAVIEDLIMTASGAPSGANKQPWTFCAVSDPELKKQIRIAAEKEEFESYNGRMSEEWLEDLAPLQTDWQKPFLEIAPWLIIVFKKAYDLDGDRRRKNYYVAESTGIACGFLLSAIHHAGLVALTHTPSPMNFLQEILGRPENERPFLLIPVGYPAEHAMIPDIRRKRAEQVIVWR